MSVSFAFSESSITTGSRPQSFSALLSSLQDDNQSRGGRPSPLVKSSAGPSQGGAPNLSMAAVPAAARSAKRPAEDQATGPISKTAKLEPKSPAKRPQAGMSKAALPKGEKPSAPTTASAGPYRGTARAPPASVSLAKSVSNPVAKPAVAATPGPSSAANAIPKPKRGFASIMERAKAAQEAAKVAGYDTIKHKPTEKLTKKDRLRIAQESKEREQLQEQPGKHTPHTGRSTSGRPLDRTARHLSQAAKSTGFRGTMRQVPELLYKGTMQRGGPVAVETAKKKNDLGQDKYGGYASWSDLDEAEDEEGYYDSESDMEEAGFDDMEAEEMQSSRIARKEDQRALEEEERLKSEKLERKKKLMALNKGAAAKKKY